MRLLSVFVAIGLFVLCGVLLLRDLPPPDSVTFAAGPQDGGYWRIAQQYQSILEREGIAVDVLETAGSIENLALLDNGTADVGLLQGGIPTSDTDVMALGTVFFEPVVVFARRDLDLDGNPALWRDLRIAWGVPGSGTRDAARQLLSALDVAPPRNAGVNLGGREAAEALLAGEVDVAFFVTSLTSGYLRPLFDSEIAEMLAFEHAAAIALRLPFSRVVTVPDGAVSLDPVAPDAPVQMVALLARLAADPGLHPAVVDRMVLAAREIHGQPSVLSMQGQFPSVDAVDMPMDGGALKLLAEGQSSFHTWLPYWVAAQIRRVLLVLLPLLFVVIPLIRSVPVAYRWSMRRRVWRHYREIHLIEMDLAEVTNQDAVLTLERRLDAVDQKLAAMRLPGAFSDGAYHARMHVDLVRRRIDERLAEMSTEA